ncbi:MAG: glycine dehydrogenase, partial [Candidatus Thermoplasmatota archaeon]|nr:glycine dehydrogenase [Candidatus Thermoplasmatota archaeon]
MNIGSEQAITKMLSDVGLEADDLFSDVPDRFRRTLDLPPGQSDMVVEEELRGELSRNVTMDQRPGLLGGGAYAHWVPPETRYLATRGEFLTAYTPYQSEINQGLLTALFEFQTISARLLDLEVANTGVYDGASGAGEACLMALRVKRRADTILVPEHLPRQRRSIIENYVLGAGGQVVDVPTDEGRGTMDLDALERLLDAHDVAGVHVELPNAYGSIHPNARLGELAHDAGALFTCMVPEVTALGLIHGPGAFGVDITAAEGQPMALPPSFGGPALGLFAA